MASQLKEALGSLCTNTDWSYALFWKLKHKALTWEEGFCKRGKETFCATNSGTSQHDLDDHIEMAMTKLSYLSYPMGDGIVGHVAFTNKHQWMFTSRRNALPTGWHEQLGAGIKTIAVIAVHQGVVQLGSTVVISEDLKLVGHVKALFFRGLQGPEIRDPLVDVTQPKESSHATLEDESIEWMPGISDMWSSLFAKGRHFEVEGHSPALQSRSCHISLGLQQKTTHIPYPPQAERLTSSLHLCIESHTQPSTSLLHHYARDTTLQVSSTRYPTSDGDASTNIAIARAEPSLINQSLDDPILDATQPDLASWCTKVHHKWPRHLLQTTIHEQQLAVLNRDEARNLDDYSSSSTCSAHQSLPDVHALDLHNCCDIEELLHLGRNTHTSHGQNSSSLVHDGDHMQNSSDKNASSDDVLQRAFRSELAEFDSFIASLQIEQAVESNELTQSPLNPLGAGASETSSHGASFWDETCSQHNTRSKHVAMKEVQEEISTSCQTFETGILGIGGYEETGDTYLLQMSRHARHVLPDIQSFCRNSEHKTSHQEVQKLEEGLSTHAGGGLPSRAGKKRSRQFGENPRPRPKDRQLIQDRLHELRNIIPSSGKCSIDALLEKTIKYMSFLQTVTEDAGILYWNDNRKVQVAEGDDGSDNRKGGASWALELGDHGRRDCPLLVKDLRQPQHMLVEMLCEEEGLFLEIANTLRGLGLKILKGIMESRDAKMWARLVVKGHEHVHRIHIMWSLLQLLETSTRAASSITNTACG